MGWAQEDPGVAGCWSDQRGPGPEQLPVPSPLNQPARVLNLPRVETD